MIKDIVVNLSVGAKHDVAADFAVLSGDLFSMEPARLNEVKVMMTVFDGRIVYRANGF